MYDDGITPMEKFSGTTTYVSINNHHTWFFQVYARDEISQGKISA